jgi:ATP adenylyltransferase
MKKLYSPWREKYITDGEKRPCVFCKQLEENDDDKNFIIKRYKNSFVMFNLYPYNGGHLMVLPLAHHGTLDECTKETRAEIMEVVNESINILKRVLKPEGLNIGMNIGKAGGGGIPSHLHFHILPRWSGDTNFLPLLSETKSISVDLVKLYKKLKPEFS